MHVAARLIGATLLTCVAPAPSAHVQPIRGLTAAPVLARVYDAIFDARFDDVPPARRRRLSTCACGGMPSVGGRRGLVADAARPLQHCS